MVGGVPRGLGVLGGSLGDFGGVLMGFRGSQGVPTPSETHNGSFLMNFTLSMMMTKKFKGVAGNFGGSQGVLGTP